MLVLISTSRGSVWHFSTARTGCIQPIGDLQAPGIEDITQVDRCHLESMWALLWGLGGVLGGVWALKRRWLGARMPQNRASTSLVRCFLG